MKRNYHVIVLMMSLLISACGNKKNQESVEIPKSYQKDTIVSIDSIEVTTIDTLIEEKKILKVDIPALLSIYDKADTFPIYVSTKRIKRLSHDSKAYEFESSGKEIPGELCGLFPYYFHPYPDSKHSGVFAVKSFEIDSGLIGLVTRIPGQYSSSRVWLLMVDLQKDSIVNHIELAETWADAGDYLQKESYIKKVSGNKFLIDLNKRSSWGEDGNKNIYLDSAISYQLTGEKLLLLKKKKIGIVSE